MSNPESKEFKSEVHSTESNSPIGTNELTINDVIIKYDKWWTVPHLVKLNCCVFIAALTTTIMGYDASMINAFQSLHSWQEAMGNPTPGRLGALSNANVLGSCLGVLVASYFNDVFGRKWGICIGTSIATIGGILQGASTNYAFFVCARFIIGIGTVISGVGSPSLISEISYPSHRPIATALYNNCWYLGGLVAAGITYGSRDVGRGYSWKIPSYLQAAMPLVQLVFLWFVPESPRFLLSKGKYEKARDTLVRIHVGGDTSEQAQALVDFEISEIESALELEKIQKTTTYMDFFKTPGNRRRLFIICFIPVLVQWSGNGLTNYYLNLVLTSIGITDEDEQLRVNIAMQAFNLVCAVSGAFLSNYLKRRTHFLLSIGIMLLCYIIWTILSAINQKTNFVNKGLGQGVLAMIFLYNFGYQIGINVLPFLYMTEVLTYSLRAKGINIESMVAQVIGIFNGFVNPIAMKNIAWKYYIVYCCILLCEIPIVYFLFPETSGMSLEEIAHVFGDDIQDIHNVISAVYTKRSKV